MLKLHSSPPLAPAECGGDQPAEAPSQSRFRRAFLHRDEVSRHLWDAFAIRVAPATLAKLASTGGGPKFHKVGRTPIYPLDEVEAWARKRLGPLLSSSSD